MYVTEQVQAVHWSWSAPKARKECTLHIPGIMSLYSSTLILRERSPVDPTTRTINSVKTFTHGRELLYAMRMVLCVSFRPLVEILSTADR